MVFGEGFLSNPVDARLYKNEIFSSYVNVSSFVWPFLGLNYFPSEKAIAEVTLGKLPLIIAEFFALRKIHFFKTFKVSFKGFIFGSFFLFFYSRTSFFFHFHFAWWFCVRYDFVVFAAFLHSLKVGIFSIPWFAFMNS